MYFSDFKLEAVNTVKRFSNFGFPQVIAPAFSTPAFSTPAIYSRIFHSCIFHSRIFSAPGQLMDVITCVKFLVDRFRGTEF